MRSIPAGKPAEVTLMLAPSCGDVRAAECNTSNEHICKIPQTCNRTDVASAWPAAK